MEEVSAFAAYQNQNGSAKKAAKNKSPNKVKKAKKDKPHFVIPTMTPQTKHKLTDKAQKQAPTSKKSKRVNVTPSVSTANGTLTSPILNKKKKTAVSGAQSQSKSNSVTVQKNKSASVSTSTSIGNMYSSSIEDGAKAFEHILSNPKYDVKYFMKAFWEKAPLHIIRKSDVHYENLKVSMQSIDEMLRTNNIEFTKNLDITSYDNGVRETLNPDGRALPGTVWDYYHGGYSIRLINPQTFIRPLHKLNAKLQEYFHCLVGANIYLTPPNSQGFAPHYDDIEAFVLQIEGKKEWSLYEPRTANEVLPRESSGNFNQDEIGEPAYKVVLEPGDLLYFPRGFIHQAKTVENCHSLHITLSVYQKTSFADLFEDLMKQTLKSAIEKDVIFRAGVPLDICNRFGETYSKISDPRRQHIKDVMTQMFDRLKDHLDFDAAVDKMATKYQHDALPPVLTTEEEDRTTFGPTQIFHSNGVVETKELNTNMEIRLLRAHIVRLVRVDDTFHLYYYADNSKEYHGSDLNFIEVEEGATGVIKKLIQSYPNYVEIRSLSNNSNEAMSVVMSLWERGLLMTKHPLK